MSAKKRFYVVLKGRKPGIYTRWDGADGAEAQVKGYVGAIFRGFVTQAAAEHYRLTGEVIADEPAPSHSPSPTTRPPASDHLQELAAGKVVLFTDGASTGNPGPGGYGVVRLEKQNTSIVRQEFSGGYACTTNNRMEIMGCIIGLQSLSSTGQNVALYSDSRYVVDAVTLGWARRWKAAQWTRPSATSNGIAPPAENADLWAQLLHLLDQHTVTFHWVRGHASHPENERCDRLAVQAAHHSHLPPDPGYESSRCESESSRTESSGTFKSKMRSNTERKAD